MSPMLTAAAERYYGTPQLVCPARNPDEVRAALKRIEQQAKAKVGERCVLVLFTRKEADG